MMNMMMVTAILTFMILLWWCLERFLYGGQDIWTVTGARDSKGASQLLKSPIWYLFLLQCSVASGYDIHSSPRLWNDGPNRNRWFPELKNGGYFHGELLNNQIYVCCLIWFWNIPMIWCVNKNQNPKPRPQPSSIPKTIEENQVQFWMVY